MTQQHTEGMVTGFEPLSPAHQGPAGGIETPNQPRGSDTMGTMTNDETYNEAPGTPGDHMNESNPDSFNGYANRETWAFNLHWQNDQGFYTWVLESATNYLTDTYGPDWAKLPEDELLDAFYGVGESTVKLVTGELAELSPELWENMREDVGSWWRIDVAEVGAAVRESLSAEGE